MGCIKHFLLATLVFIVLGFPNKSLGDLAIIPAKAPINQFAGDARYEADQNTEDDDSGSLEILGGFIGLAVNSLVIWYLYRKFWPTATAAPAPAPAPAADLAPVEIQFFERRPHPTDAYIQQQIPTAPFSTFDQAAVIHDTCVVCMEGPFQPEDVVSRIPSCTHIFHSSCLATWMALADTCPLCRLGISL